MHLATKKIIVDTIILIINQAKSESYMVDYRTIKEQLIEALQLEDITADEINDDAPLFSEGLGLDSVDAIELVIFLDNNYGIKMDNIGQSREIFTSIRTMTDYVNQNASV
ncbi:MAG: phosphopantetheine-binding protein [Sulfurovaceae bacterium]|nr:phosphopantetheine-binding protein [Sulfurovaceae bacterium]